MCKEIMAVLFSIIYSVYHTCLKQRRYSVNICKMIICKNKWRSLIYNTILSLQKHSDIAIADKSLRTITVYIVTSNIIMIIMTILQLIIPRIYNYYLYSIHSQCKKYIFKILNYTIEVET